MDEYTMVETIFGNLLLDPKTQHWFGSDDRINDGAEDNNPPSVCSKNSPLYFSKRTVMVRLRDKKWTIRL